MNSPFYMKVSLNHTFSLDLKMYSKKLSSFRTCFRVRIQNTRRNCVLFSNSKVLNLKGLKRKTVISSGNKAGFGSNVILSVLKPRKKATPSNCLSERLRFKDFRKNGNPTRIQKFLHELLKHWLWSTKYQTFLQYIIYECVYKYTKVLNKKK